MSTKDSEKEILNSKKYVSDPYDTHIKKMLSAIKLNFEFNGIAKFHQGETIGYAPAGTYENGWTGIAEFFYRNDLGTCEFVKEKINYMMISKDDVTYQVNDKITMTNIEGSNNSGYTYKVGWYFADENKMVLSQELECANMKFDKKIMANMITLANRIDK